MLCAQRKVVTSQKSKKAGFFSGGFPRRLSAGRCVSSARVSGVRLHQCLRGSNQCICSVFTVTQKVCCVGRFGGIPIRIWSRGHARKRAHEPWLDMRSWSLHFEPASDTGISKFSDDERGLEPPLDYRSHPARGPQSWCAPMAETASTPAEQLLWPVGARM